VSHDPAAEKRAKINLPQTGRGSSAQNATKAPPLQPARQDAATRGLSSGNGGVQGAGKGMRSK